MNPITALPQVTQTDATKQAEGPAKPTPEVLKVARDFEAIFLRTLLAPMEKATQMGGKSQVAGQAAYGSMVVGALADSLSTAGGIGLSDVIAKAMMARAEPHKGGG